MKHKKGYQRALTGQGRARGGEPRNVPPKGGRTKVPVKTAAREIKIELVNIADLRPHPRNYREHPEDQVGHLEQSIRENGFYRNVVITRDNIILAGHGVIKAAAKIGVEKVPVIRLDIDSKNKRALKILVGDNETARLAMPDDRALTELLRELKDWNADALLGTGFDEKMLAALVYVTRPMSEIKNMDEAAHWAGMPEYDEGERPLNIVISFRNEADREAFANQTGLMIMKKESKSWSTWWPEKQRDDASSVSFVENEA